MSQYTCPNPNCGCHDFKLQGYQWFPTEVFELTPEWKPFLVTAAGGQSALRMFTCRRCDSTFLEPSLTGLPFSRNLM
ncbi:MAG: hypothetical protein JXB47_20795 [Anaerolineae bacterium]|nr:hypothetical protein [Anaerolineae bacterium]